MKRNQTYFLEKAILLPLLINILGSGIVLILANNFLKQEASVYVWLIVIIFVLFTSLFIFFAKRNGGLKKFIIFNGFITIDNSMIGFTEKCIELEKNAEKFRYSMNKHLPSFIRSKVLTSKQHKKIRRNWASSSSDYLELVNDRHRLFKTILENGEVQVKEIYEKKSIENYAKTGVMFCGGNKNSPEERISRLKELHRLLTEYEEHRYDIKVTSENLYFPFLVSDRELVIDIGRQTKNYFEGGLGGIYSNSRKRVAEYHDFFNNVWKNIKTPEESDRESIKEWLKLLIKEVEKG